MTISTTTARWGTTIALILATGCAPVVSTSPARPAPPATPAARVVDPDATSKVRRLLDAWHAAAARADEEAYFGLFDAQGVFLGTDATERWDAKAFREYAHPHFARGKAWAFSSTRRDVLLAPSGDLAWFDEDLATPGLGPARGSGVAVLRPEGWRVLHYVLSITVPNDRFDATKHAASRAIFLRSEGALEDLGWLAGGWIGREAGASTLEIHWGLPAGTAVLGWRRSTAEGRSGTLTNLRIEARKAGVTLILETVGSAGPIELVRSNDPATPGAVTFLGKKGEKLSFDREGDLLNLRTERVPDFEDATYPLTPAVMDRPAPR